MAKKRNCATCGVEIDTGDNGKRMYCQKCVIDRKRASKRASEARNKYRQKPRKRKKKKAPAPPLPMQTIPIPELNRLAREQGLSYGQMSAILRDGGKISA